MNIKLLSLVLLFTATGAMAAGGNDHLDIQHVVSTTPVPGTCQVEPATMVYLDSQGVSHTVNYQVMGTCQGGV